MHHLPKLVLFLAVSTSTALHAGTALGKDGAATAAGTPQTRIDFSDTLIDGKMKAPEGFFLQGKRPQGLLQMVKLRTNFRSEMRNSQSAVRYLAK